MTDLLNPQVHTTDKRWQGTKKWSLLDRGFRLRFCGSAITTSSKPTLDYLHLADCAITDIVSPTKLYRCQDLNPNNDQITNTAPLKHLKYPHLDSVELADNPIGTPNRYCLHQNHQPK